MRVLSTESESCRNKNAVNHWAIPLLPLSTQSHFCWLKNKKKQLFYWILMSLPLFQPLLHRKPLQPPTLGKRERKVERQAYSVMGSWALRPEAPACPGQREGTVDNFVLCLQKATQQALETSRNGEESFKCREQEMRVGFASEKKNSGFSVQNASRGRPQQGGSNHGTYQTDCTAMTWWWGSVWRGWEGETTLSWASASAKMEAMGEVCVGG